MLYFLKWAIWGPCFVVGFFLLLAGQWGYGVLLWSFCFVITWWQWRTWGR